MRKYASAFLTVLLMLGTFSFFVPNSLFAASLQSGSLTLSDSRPNTASVSYTFSFSNVTTTPIKCISVQFSDASTGGSKPAGLTITGATFGGTSTYVPTPASWTVTNNNTSGLTTLTYATGETPASSSARTVVLNAITNGSTAATTYFVRFATFNNVDCATSPVDNQTIAFIYTNGQVVSATVDPTLSFTIAGVASAQTVNGVTTNVSTTATTVPLGTLSTSTNTVAAQDLTVGTNAQSGYTVTIRYTGALTNGTANFTNFASPNSAPTTFSAAGTEAFGYTTNDATLGTGTAARFTSSGGQKFAGFTTSPLEVAYSATAASETTRVGYQAGISAATPAGSYTTTVVFVATPTY